MRQILIAALIALVVSISLTPVLIKVFSHHFELAGWAETTVIIRFWLLGGISAAIGLMLFYAEYLAA